MFYHFKLIWSLWLDYNNVKSKTYKFATMSGFAMLDFCFFLWSRSSFGRYFVWLLISSVYSKYEKLKGYVSYMSFLSFCLHISFYFDPYSRWIKLLKVPVTMFLKNKIIFLCWFIFYISNNNYWFCRLATLCQIL